jgi:intracellular multiplication protein IcmN
LIRLANSSRFICAFVAFLCLILLTACRAFGPNYTIVKPPPSLPYNVEGSSDKQMIKMQGVFAAQGASVITMGQDYLISIPAATLFQNQSPRLSRSSYTLLNQVVCYLNLFRKVSVSVEAYSSKCGSVEREKALSLARAQAVANYLWSQSIDSRFIFTHGHGSDKPIVNIGSGTDLSPNARIEILFRDAVA